MLRRWLDTPIIIWEYDWMPRVLFVTFSKKSLFHTIFYLSCGFVVLKPFGKKWMTFQYNGVFETSFSGFRSNVFPARQSGWAWRRWLPSVVPVVGLWPISKKKHFERDSVFSQLFRKMKIQENYNTPRYRTPQAIPLANYERNPIIAYW